MSLSEEESEALLLDAIEVGICDRAESCVCAAESKLGNIKNEKMKLKLSDSCVENTLQVKEDAGDQNSCTIYKSLDSLESDFHYNLIDNQLSKSANYLDTKSASHPASAIAPQGSPVRSITATIGQNSPALSSTIQQREVQYNLISKQDCFPCQVDDVFRHEDEGSSHSELNSVELHNTNGHVPVELHRINGHIVHNSDRQQHGYLLGSSRETSQSSDSIICRICHSAGDDKLITPCKCAGSTRYVHASCLVTWFKRSVKNQCELCQSIVKIRKINHNISVWRKPEGRPIPLIWFSVFFIGFFLNILSIYVNASEYCKSTACLIFYIVNAFGIILDAAFLWFWFLKCCHYWQKWCALNQDWFIDDLDETENKNVPIQYVRNSDII